MKEIKQLIEQAYGAALSYLVHLVFVAVAAFALSHGFHVSIPVIPGSLTTWSVLGFARLALGRLGHAWHTGKLEAELEADAKRDASQVISQVVAAAEGKGAAKAA